jgi:ankyrin repeat protein
VRLLLDAGAQVNASGERKVSPLMIAAQLGHDDVVALLIEWGADPSQKAEGGLTALDLARMGKHPSTVKLLEKK